MLFYKTKNPPGPLARTEWAVLGNLSIARPKNPVKFKLSAIKFWLFFINVLMAAGSMLCMEPHCGFQAEAWSQWITPNSLLRFCLNFHSWCPTLIFEKAALSCSKLHCGDNHFGPHTKLLRLAELAKTVSLSD